MGNGVTKLNHCFAGTGEISRRHDIAVILGDPLHEGLGHSFYYVPPDMTRLSSSPKVIHSSEYDDVSTPSKTTLFHSISGASVSANASTPLSTAPIDSYQYSSTTLDRASTFESSDSFASLPLQPVPRGGGALFHSRSGNITLSGPIERGFMSGPIERGFLSGPLDRGLYSSPIEREIQQGNEKLKRSISQTLPTKKGNRLIKIFKRVISRKISKKILDPINRFVSVKESDSDRNQNESITLGTASTNNLSSNLSSSLYDDDSEFSMKSQNLQWAQGKAGEDRVHVVISEENGWIFVGIYDGFNGPDAPDYLLTNLYPAVHKELKGLLWNEKSDSETPDDFPNRINQSQTRKPVRDGFSAGFGVRVGSINHSEVLNALSMALSKTEDSYLDIADKMVMENPELALMGSCVLVMLMKGEDIYLMNVGDSRAVLAKKPEGKAGISKVKHDAKRIIKERSKVDLWDEYGFHLVHNLTSVQLTLDHSTYVDEEVERIKKEHPDDGSAIMNERVKGYLKVTRAFGAGFLKQPKWNDALLEMFRIDYIGTSPYLTCTPSLYHHKLTSTDRFLILSSDGLYQYFTNEDAVAEVESFIASYPEGDPAQHLIEEVLFRAAKKYGMDFHELLDIPQGDRRRYHDDVSVIIISLEGRIWRSSM